jgi:hypothetical protein
MGQEDLQVIHALPGRVRVHPAQRQGYDLHALAARTRQLPGVLHASANEHTGNLLVQFDPARLALADLLTHLRQATAVALPVPLPAEALVQGSGHPVRPSFPSPPVWRAFRPGSCAGRVGPVSVHGRTTGRSPVPILRTPVRLAGLSGQIVIIYRIYRAQGNPNRSVALATVPLSVPARLALRLALGSTRMTLLLRAVAVARAVLDPSRRQHIALSVILALLGV